MSRLLRCEQETIINSHVGEKMTSFFTVDSNIMRNLDSLVIEYPDTFKCIMVNDISKTYTMPKNSVTYRKPRRMSEEQRAAARIRILKINDKNDMIMQYFRCIKCI